MACELCNRHAHIGRKRILKFRRGRGVADPQGGEFLARVDKGVIRFTWDHWLCNQCNRLSLVRGIEGVNLRRYWGVWNCVLETAYDRSSWRGASAWQGGIAL